KLTPNKGSDQTELQERLAAAIYKQGENARNGNNLKEAAAHFLRVGETVPTTSIRSTAEYDAATIFISIKDWNKAISVLERFRQAYPQHPLQADVTSKLAVCYLEDGNLQKAAVEFEVIAATNDNSDIQRDALMQAATLYQKVNDTDAAINTYSRYISSFPQPLDEAMEVHATIAALYAQTRQPDKQKHWLKQIIQADRNAHGSRTDRSRFLASQASLQLAKFDYQNYQSIKLTLPLEKTLKKKKQAMESSLEAYNRVLEYNIAAMTTAASYQIAVIYTDFSKALLNSQRPRGLSDIELEQYDILLEEQAFPFEEEAIAAHEINALRVAQGIYDDWVKKSFDELAKLLPVRYAKAEKGEESINELK
ncbi:MAG TPA: tetratricopeptide repeat protein, partial [Gammaproteobacteria bacterium]